MKAIPEYGTGRLMFFLQRRLAELQWSREDLAGAGGPAPSTLYKAHRDDRELSERTLARLELAVGWQPGSAQRTMAGAAPSVVVADLTETASGRIDATMRGAQAAGVRDTAAELRDFLIGVAQRLERFYSLEEPATVEVAGASAC